MSSFPCTKCGACCRVVRGRAEDSFREKGWIADDGSCINYDPITKDCKIYDDRPIVCRVDMLRPIEMEKDEWYASVEKHCDSSHSLVYGADRERGSECNHVEKVPGLQLQMETISTCNARCRFCVYPTAMRQGGVMSRALFRKIINETAAIREITSYVLHGLGEPLLDVLLTERIKYIKWLKPEASIEIYTNGLLLTPDRFEDLKAAGITSVVVSLNAVSEKQHRFIMGMANKFDTICSNIDYVIAHPGEVKFQVHAVIDDENFTRKDAIEFYSRWGHRNEGGYGICVVEGNWAGDDKTVGSFDPKSCCDRAVGQVYVLYDGRVSMCCFDPTGKTVFGDLSKQTIRDIYNNDNYLKFRIAHWENRADEYEQCRGCSRI